VRTALQRRFGDNEKEIELMLRRYGGQHLTAVVPQEFAREHPLAGEGSGALAAYEVARNTYKSRF